MMKDSVRQAACRNDSLSISPAILQCSHFHAIVHDARDGDRLRACQVAPNVRLYTRKHRDAVLKRIFSRGEIRAERAAARNALLRAAANVTPERLKRLGSPGRQAVAALRQTAARGGRHDIKCLHVRSAVSLLAGGGRTRRFRGTPVKSIRLISAENAALGAHSDALRRALHCFCEDFAGRSRLSGLLRLPGERLQVADGCTAMCMATVTRFLGMEISGAHHAANTLAEQLNACSGEGAYVKNPLLQCFIGRWMEARTAGLIKESDFGWVAALDWLTAGMQPSRPPAPRTSHKPRSTRSPSGLASPSRFSPPGTRPASAPRALPFRSGRQAANLQMRDVHASPSRLAAPARGALAAPKRKAGMAALRRMDAARAPAEKNATAPSRLQAGVPAGASAPVHAGAAVLHPTLGDMLYLVSIGKSPSQWSISVYAELIALAVGGDEKLPNGTADGPDDLPATAMPFDSV